MFCRTRGPGSLANLPQDGLWSTKPALVAENAPPPALAAAGQLASDASLPGPVRTGNGSQGKSGSAEPRPAENTPPSALTAAQPVSGMVLLNVAHGSPESFPLANDSGLGSQESPRADRAAGTTAPGPTLLASASFGAEKAATLPFSFATNRKSGEATSANAVAHDTAVQTEVSAQPGAENLLSAIMNGQVPPSTILNSAVQWTPGKAAPQFAAARVTAAVANPTIREAGSGAGARTSILSSTTAVLPAGSDPGEGSAMASPTPFSVFFSGPGPGTESAVSVLPKMILPATGSAIRDSHLGGGNAASVTPQTSGLPGGPSPGGVSPGGVSRNAAPPNPKDSGTASGSLQTIPPSHRDAELSAASTQLAGSQSAAAPVPAPPTSAAGTLPQAGPAAPATDSLPKPDPLPAGAAAPSARSGPRGSGNAGRSRTGTSGKSGQPDRTNRDADRDEHVRIRQRGGSHGGARKRRGPGDRQ